MTLSDLFIGVPVTAVGSGVREQDDWGSLVGSHCSGRGAQDCGGGVGVTNSMAEVIYHFF